MKSKCKCTRCDLVFEKEYKVPTPASSVLGDKAKRIEISVLPPPCPNCGKWDKIEKIGE